MTNLIVSIVTPSFNRAHLLPRAWNSIRNESVSLEWIVVDDASTDSTSSVIKGFGDSRIVFLRLSENKGSNIARNAGVRVARGRFVLFLDSDDELAPDALRAAVEALEHGPPRTGAVLMIAQPTFTNTLRSTLPDGAVLNEEDLVIHNRLRGDRAVLYRSEVFRNQMLPEEYRESQFVFVFGVSRWWDYLVANKPLTLVHRQSDNLSQAQSVVTRSSDIARGWEEVIHNHAAILHKNPPSRVHLYGRVLYRYAVAGDHPAWKRAFKELRAGHPDLVPALRSMAMVIAGMIGRLGADRLRITWIRLREGGIRRSKQGAQEVR
jgi:glycosyltransferase involved in cell wall biosynthesis